MITKSERAELVRLMEEVRCAQQLAVQFSQGWTNKTSEEVTEELSRTNLELRIFLDNITET